MSLSNGTSRRVASRFALGLALALVAAGSAVAAPSGSLYILDHALDPGSKTFEKDAKAGAKKALTKAEDGWHVYFVAYLKRSPGAPEVNLVFYEPGAKEPVNHFPIGTSPSAKIMMSELVIGADTGIKAGKYDVRLTLLAGGKEEVLARASLELK